MKSAEALAAYGQGFSIGAMMQNSSGIKNAKPEDEGQEHFPDAHPRDGHLRIPNTVAEALARLRVNGSQAQIVWAVLRKTLGWQKSGAWKNDAYPISLTDVKKATAVSRSQALRDIEDLTRRRVLNRQPRKGKAPLLSLNLDVAAWAVAKHLAEMIPVSEMTLASGMTPGGVRNDTSTGVRSGIGVVAEMIPVPASTQARLNKPKETLKKHTKETEGGPSTPSLGPHTPASTYLFEKTGRKRWQNLVQKEQFEKAESEVGEARMKEAIDWALTSGISNVKSMLTAARKGKGGEIHGRAGENGQHTQLDIQVIRSGENGV